MYCVLGEQPPLKHHDLPQQNKTRYHRCGYSLLHLLIFTFAEFFSARISLPAPDDTESGIMM